MFFFEQLVLEEHNNNITYKMDSLWEIMFIRITLPYN
jgi:hypothetical protein